MKWIAAIVFLAVAAFCLFGFMATFEPGVADAIAFRIGYCLVGIFSFGLAAWALLRRSDS